jgi:hypothetical protein
MGGLESQTASNARVSPPRCADGVPAAGGAMRLKPLWAIMPLLLCMSISRGAEHMQAREKRKVINQIQ